MADDADKKALESTLTQLAGTTGAELRQLIQAIERTAVEEAFDLITGRGPVPSSMADTRALRLRRLNKHAGRPLRTREIEIVFRVGTSAARSIDTRMHATYPLAMRDLRAERLKAMRAGATVTTYKDDGHERYRVSFDSRSSREFGYELLSTAQLTKGLQQPDDQTLTFPLRMERADGTKVHALKTVLELQEPAR